MKQDLRLRSCSVKRGDALHLPVEMVDEHLARRILTGDPRSVLDRVVELPEPVEVLSAAPARPPAVFLLDDPEEIRAHGSTFGSARRTTKGQTSRAWTPFAPLRRRGAGRRRTERQRSDTPLDSRQKMRETTRREARDPVVSKSLPPPVALAWLSPAFLGRTGSSQAELRPVSSEGQGASRDW